MATISTCYIAFHTVVVGEHRL